MTFFKTNYAIIESYLRFGRKRKTREELLLMLNQTSDSDELTHVEVFSAYIPLRSSNCNQYYTLR